MKNKPNLFQRMLALVLALVMIVGLLPELSLFAKAAVGDAIAIMGDKKADPGTIHWEDYFGANKLDTEFAGAVWTDKSVFLAETPELPGVTLSDQNNFLIALSAIAANATITGHTTSPTDTMLVLDLSGSMAQSEDLGYNRNGNRINGKKVDLVQAMVDATNATIAELMSANTNNRVGVILYSGNTNTSQAATTGSATVVLPLDRYEGVAVGEGTAAHLEYLSMDAALQTSALYEWVSTGRYNGYWNATGESVSYATGDVKVSVKSGLKKESGGNVSNASKTVVGGTYIQNGLYKALQQFEAVTDITVPDGRVQAGAKRTPVIVLMSDGAPTIATTDYNNVGTSNTGDGSSTNDRITFLTQLTAAYVKGAVAEHYQIENSKVLFMSLGLGTGNSTAATNVLYPSGSAAPLTDYWKTYLAAEDDRSVSVSDDLTVTRDDMVAEMNYVSHYWYADNAQSLIDSFGEIVSQIQLQAEYYATLVEGGNADFSGYVTFEDELGELMEVAEMKGLLMGSILFTGKELTKGMNEGVLGTPGAATERGDAFMATVQERIPGLTMTMAQQLVDDAYNDHQLYYENDQSWSNYIGWYADENGNYIGFWDKDAGYTNAPAGAVYANKSYGYLGVNGDSDMMHVVVLVRTDLRTLHQTVFFKIPAALLPTVTYNVTLDENDPTKVKAFSRDGAEPLQLVFEVGLRSDINSVNLEQKVAEHLQKGGHVHRNDDGSITLYTNSWAVGQDKNGNGVPDPEEMATAVVAESHFHPSLENDRYYYTEDTLILDAQGNPVTAEGPLTDINGDAEGTGYFVERWLYTQTTATAKLVGVSLETLTQSAKQNENGQWYVPAGVTYKELTRFRTEKVENVTGTLEYARYAAVFSDSEHNTDVYTFLGNNGSITIAPATGIALTKEVTGTIADTDRFTFTVTLDSIPEGKTPNPVVTDANGEPLADVTSTAYENGSFTVTMPAGVTAYLTGIPSGTHVTVTENISGDYKVVGVTVDGAEQAVAESVQVTIPTYSQTEAVKLILPVTFTNAPRGYGDLVITKDVTHPYAADPDALATKVFTFQVTLTGERVKAGDTFHSTEGTVVVGAGGMLSLADGSPITLKNEESVTIYDIPEGTVYTVKESLIPNGFRLDTVNGEKVTEASGVIVADGTGTAGFVNRYPDTFQPVSIPVNITIDKILEDPNGQYNLDEDFVFVLQGLDPVTQQYAVVEDYVLKANQSVTEQLMLTFNAIGIYHYRLTEVAPADQLPAKTNTPGMTYSTTRGLFAAEVTDNDMDGVLELVIREEANVSVTAQTDAQEHITAYNVGAEFTNIYELNSTSISVGVHKELINNTGAEKSLTEFRFGLYAVDAGGNAAGEPLKVVTVGALGDATFNILIDRNEDLQYIIKEIIPAEAKLNSQTGKYELNGMIYDSTVYELAVDVEAQAGGQLGVVSQTLTNKATGATAEKAVFSNTYVLKETKQSLTLTKELTGRPLKDGEVFQFYLVRTDGTFRNALTGPDAYNGTYTVPTGTYALEIPFQKAGTYHYKVTELVPDEAVLNTHTGKYELNGVTYDSAEYHITITVADNGDGTLAVSAVAIHKLGQTEAAEALVFTNVYNVTGTDSVTVGGSKVLNGRAHITGEFLFGLYEDLNSAPVAVAQTLPDQTFLFEALTFTTADLGPNNESKTYTYYVKEILPPGIDSSNPYNGVTYDTTVKTVTVTVSHDGNGDLVVRASENAAAITFTNTYKAADVSVTIHGSKNLVGDWSAVQNKVFTFELYKADANFTVTDTTPVATRTVDGKGFFSFSQTYVDGQEGTYYFVLREDTSAAAGGIGYDASEYHITVSISDPGKGQLVASVRMYHPGSGNVAVDTALNGPVASFNNAYSVSPTTATIHGQKYLLDLNTNQNRQLVGGEFSFEILEDGSVVSRGTNAADGSITFEPITYTAPGNHTYTVQEVVGDAGGVSYDSSTLYTVDVTVTDNGDGTLTATVDYNGTAVVFNNQYSTNTTSVKLEGQKYLLDLNTNRNWQLVGGEFSFEILENGQSVSSGTNKADGTIDFENITYTAAGEHTYTVVEAEGNMPGVTYDKRVYTVKVTVTDNGDGTLSAKVEYSEPVVFHNGYKAAAAELELEATKTYDKPLAGDDFTFTLTGTDGNGAVSQEKKNDAEGKITFDKLVFHKAGTYTFTAKETNEQLSFVDYDASEYEIVVTVTDEGDGQLKAEYTVNTVKNGDIIFDNGYILDGDGSLRLEGTKTVTGDTDAVKEFSFGLYDAEGNLKETVVNDTEGRFAFTAITFDETDAGNTFYYTVREILPKAEDGSELTEYKGYIYDTTVYTVAVTVADDNAGGIKVTYTVNGSEDTPITFENQYRITGTAALEVEGTKTLTGKTLTDGSFRFGLYDAQGNLVAQAQNADGKFVLKAEGFGKGHIGTALTYTIKEILPLDEAGNPVTTLDGVIYDTTVYTVAVTVTDNGEGGVDVSYALEGAQSIDFVNSYKVPDMPDTGDYTNMVLLYALLFVSGTALVTMFIIRKRYAVK